MGDPEQKALELMAQAEKKMKSTGGFFGSLMGYVVRCRVTVKCGCAEVVATVSKVQITLVLMISVRLKIRGR